MPRRRLYKYIGACLAFSLGLGALYWVLDGVVDHYFFHHNLRFMLLRGPETLADSILWKVSFDNLFSRLSFLVASLFLGLTLFLFLVHQEAARRRITQSERKLREILDLVPYGIAEIDTQGTFLYHNPAYKKLFGYDEGELVGRKVFELQASEENGESLRSELELLLREQPEPAIWTGRNLTRDGREIEVEVAWDYKRDDQGEVVGFIFSTVDVTERDKARRELMDAKEQAEGANAAKDEFLANMSHELRTPLNGVLGMLQLLRESDLSEEQRRFATVAIEAGRRLTRLLGDLLDLASIESGRLAAAREEMLLSEILRSVEEMYRGEAVAKSLGFRVVLDPALPSLVMGDPARLRQILYNVTGNAIKFASHGDVRLDASVVAPFDSGRGRVLFTISDTGPGISDKEVDSICDSFIQTERSYTRHYQGAGLGLALVRRLVGLLGGAMSIVSEQGLGTTVYVSLPMEASSEAASGRPAASPRPAGRVRGAVRSALVAEDDGPSQMTIKRALESHGIRVQCAENGREALELLARDAYDLVLMDIRMPVMNGVEAARAIRFDPAFADKADIPIIAVTAYAMPGEKREIMASGMDGYLAKPLRVDELFDVIGSLSGEAVS